MAQGPNVHPQYPQAQHYDTESGSSSSGGSSDERGMRKQWFDGHEEQYQGLIGLAPPNVRKGFIQKVYTILSFQLMLTFLIAAPLASIVPKTWIAQNVWIMNVAYLTLLVSVVGVACCCQQVARQFPLNYCFLFVVTVSMSIVVGFVTSFYTTPSVLMAVATTAATFFLLTAYACFTKTDFTGLGPYLFGALLGMIGFSLVVTLVGLFYTLPPWVQVLYSLFGVLLFCFYIIYDTQMIIGGNHKMQFSVDDYAFAALNLYMDIINLFLYLLSLMGQRN